MNVIYIYTKKITAFSEIELLPMESYLNNEQHLNKEQYW